MKFDLSNKAKRILVVWYTFHLVAFLSSSLYLNWSYRDFINENEWYDYSLFNNRMDWEDDYGRYEFWPFVQFVTPNSEFHFLIKGYSFNGIFTQYDLSELLVYFSLPIIILLTRGFLRKSKAN